MLSSLLLPLLALLPSALAGIGTFQISQPLQCGELLINWSHTGSIAATDYNLVLIPTSDQNQVSTQTISPSLASGAETCAGRSHAGGVLWRERPSEGWTSVLRIDHPSPELTPRPLALAASFAGTVQHLVHIDNQHVSVSSPPYEASEGAEREEVGRVV